MIKNKTLHEKRNDMSSSDTELFKQIQEHNETSLELLYDQYEKLLFSFAFRIIGNKEGAEEAVQDVFTKIWTQKVHFDPSKGKFSSWILTVTRNICIDRLRKKTVPVYELDERDALHDPGTSIENQIEWKEENELLKTAVQKLSSDQQEMIELCYFKGYSQSSIAKACHIPLGTVKGRVRLALRHLHTELYSVKEGGIQDGQ